jgi:hemoglobin
MNTHTLRLAAAFALATTLSAALAAQAPKKDTLYKRLGGYDAIAAVTDDFVPRLVTDPQLAKYFAGASNDSKMHIRQLAVDFICFATGGPCLYIGRSMKTSHAGLGINEAEWDAGVKHFIESLDKFNVPMQEKNELVAAVGALKADIVEKK